MREDTIIFIIIIILMLLYIIYRRKYYYKKLDSLYIINLYNTKIKIKYITTDREYYNNSVDVDYYIIHDTNNKTRSKNVSNNQEILGKNIKIFNAVMIKEYNPDKIKQKYDLEGVNGLLLPGEIGCFLSHLTLLRSINKKDGYTVIFEDDLNIIDKDMHNNILKILNNIDEDFDMIFLGNLNDNHGESLRDNIYKIDNDNYLWGTQAYLVNNKSVPHILKNINNLYQAIDNVYVDNSKQGKIKSFVIYPIMVGQLSTTIGSTIR